MFGLNDPLFTTGYQMTPSFGGFFTPMTLLLLHLVRNGLVLLGLFTEWPHILESTHFTW